MRPVALQNSRQASHHVVVDERAKLLGLHIHVDVRIEHLEKILDAVGGGVSAKLLERLKGAHVSVDVVKESYRIEPEVGKLGFFYVAQICGPKRTRRGLPVRRRPRAPNFRRIVGAERRLDGAAFERLRLLQHLQVRRRHQHDVDEVLSDDLGDVFEELGSRAELGELPSAARMGPVPGNGFDMSPSFASAMMKSPLAYLPERIFASFLSKRCI